MGGFPRRCSHVTVDRRPVTGLAAKATWAVDYDGTIANTNAQKAEWIRRNLGCEVPSWSCNRTDCIPLIDQVAYERMADEVYERDSTLQADEVRGAAVALRTLSEVGKVYILTARPRRRMEYAREWLSQRGLAALVTDVITSHGLSKATRCRAIGASALIDDDARHLTASDLGSIARILLQDGRTDVPPCAPGVMFCHGWADVLQEFGLRCASDGYLIAP